MSMNCNCIAQIAELSRSIEDGDTWTNELNIVSWDDKEPVFDIRQWNATHSVCRTGIKLSAEEMKNLVDGFSNYAKDVGYEC